jgi:hypothetical protein
MTNKTTNIKRMKTLGLRIFLVRKMSNLIVVLKLFCTKRQEGFMISFLIKERNFKVGTEL